MRHQQEVNEKKRHLSIKKMILHSPSKLACVRVDPLTISPLHKTNHALKLLTAALPMSTKIL